MDTCLNRSQNYHIYYRHFDYYNACIGYSGIGGKHGLPESAHSSEAYIKLNSDGTFREMRLYDKNHVLYMEIAYHPEPSLTGNRHTPVMHYHLYDSRFSQNSTGPFSRTGASLLTDEMKGKYKKFFKGVKGYSQKYGL